MENHSADLRLLIQARVGNEDKFMALFNCYTSLVKRLWQKYYVADLELEDWYQEAQVVLLKVIYSYHGEDINQFSGFYKRSLINRLLDLYRARQAGKRIPAEQLDGLGESEEITLNSSFSLDDIVYCHQSIDQTIATSSPFEQQVLLFVISGKSVKTICRELGCSQRQVQSALYRSKKKLLEILTGGC